MPFLRTPFFRSICALLVGLSFICSTRAADEIDFNRDIRPILAENCFYCHGQDSNKREADLRLDLRSAALESKAIVPGDAKASSIVTRIHATDDSQMPPVKSNRRLTDAQKQLLERWIDGGGSYLEHWAFTVPVLPTLPDVTNSERCISPIDRFIQARLEQASLSPSPVAQRPTLIKRLSIDLLGLPPTIDEVESFAADERPDAYERLVDRLLASPRYGERMALPWLDAARYADSNGFQQDGDTWQWLWRDWVVRSMNADLPFDQFTIWQLAGDLLPNASEDQKIASGFNRNHLLNGEGGAIAEEQRWVNLFDRMDTTATNWLGLTMACAQCHDHKYDPLTMKDYYSLLDAFNRVPESGTPQRFSSRIRVAPPVIEVPTEENKAHIAAVESQINALEPTAKVQQDAARAGWQAAVTVETDIEAFKSLPEKAKAILKKPEGERGEDEKKDLDSVLRKHFDEKVRPSLMSKLPDFAKQDALRKELAEYKADQIPRPMIMSDEKPRETAILERGEYLKPTTKVSFAPPAFLPPLPEGAPNNRLGFALWLMAPNHPLTARVQTNRMWQHFFGMGIVKTTEDFGVQSEYPLHLPLLDWLSVEFRDRGWSSKWMHRQIVLSATYRQSSRVTSELRGTDSDNKFFARASRFRMPSMLLRDWALAASDLMDRSVGGQPVYPYQPDAVWEALAITKERDFTYPASSGANLYRRSLYTFWRRTVGPANMFDASNRQTCRVRLATTSTPLHALTTLNDPTWVEAARIMAQRVMHAAPATGDQLRIVGERILCRTLNQAELSALTNAYEKQLAIYRQDVEACKSLLAVGQAKCDEGLPLAEHAALTQVCLAVLNLDESLTRE